MVSILTPLIFYVALLYLIIHLYITIRNMLFKITYKSPKITRYKIENITLSSIIVLTYIKFFIIFVYISRLYNLGRYIDLKIICDAVLGYNFILNIIWVPRIILVLVLVLILGIIITVIICFVLLNRRIYEEIYKLYIYFAYDDYLEKNHYTKNIYSILKDISKRDIIAYITSKIAYYFTIKTSSKNYDYMKLPWYHIMKIQASIFVNYKYDLLSKFSPIIIIIYDCLYNDFVLLHVYYYLLFYIPMRLLYRVTSVCSSHSYYMGNLIWEICYKRDGYLYAISPKYKPFLDNYVFLGLNMNFDLGIDAELFLYNHVRFEIIDIEKLVYVNTDSIELQRIGYKFYELSEDDNGHIILSNEWFILKDNTKLAQKKYTLHT